MKSIFCASLFLLLACGCASLTTKPYAKAPENASLEERQRLFDQHRVTYDPWTGYEVGGRKPMFRSWNLYDGFADYFERSGDPDSAELAVQGKPAALYGLAAGLAGALGAVALYAANGFSLASPWVWLALGGGLSGDAVLNRSGNRAYLRPAAMAFNRYLAQDLGLGNEPEGLDDRSAPGFGPTPGGAIYGTMGFGFADISNYDLMDYYLRPGGNNHWSDGSVVAPQVALGGGYIHPSGATLELRYNFLERGRAGLWWNQHPENPDRILELSAQDLGLIPGYTFKLHETGRGQQFLLFAGCQVGAAYLTAEGIQGNAAGAELGHYQLRDWAFEGGPLLRIQGPALPFPKWVGVGLECGYKMERFTDIQVTDSDGSYAGRPSPDQTLRGTPSALDFSGPYVNVSFLFGRLRFSR